MEPRDSGVSGDKVVPWAGPRGGELPGCRPPRSSGAKAAAPLEVEAGMLGEMKFKKTNTGGEP